MLTPGQIWELKQPKNCRGKIGSAVLYTVTIRQETFERAGTLSSLGELPVDVVWYVHLASTNRVEVFTNMPEWFVDLEEKIENVRRQR